MMTDIGHGGPAAGVLGGGGSGPADAWAIEALARHIGPEQIVEVLARTGSIEQRRRRLPSEAVVLLMVMMGLRADLDMAGLWRQVCGAWTQTLAALSAIKPVAKSALSKARGRVGARPLRQLMLLTGRTPTAGVYYRQMRLLAMDGDSYKLCDTPANAAAFGRPTTARDGTTLEGGYPQLHLTRLIDAGTRVTIEALVRPCNSSDHDTAQHLLSAAVAGALVLFDCGYYSFELMQLAGAQQKFFLCPVPAHAVLRPIRHLADGSYLVRCYATPSHRRDDRGGIVLRVLEYTLDEPARKGHAERHRLISNLLEDAACPALELIVLYHERWEIEIANDEITTHQLGRPVELRSKIPAGVVQEMYAVLLAHNAVRLAMAEAALPRNLDPRTLSFINAVRVVREAVQQMRDAPTARLPLIYRGMLQQIATCVLPLRDGRINPRVVKVIRPSNFPVKKPHHRNFPQPKKTFIESIVMLK